MRHRCRNPKNPFFKQYGARGITVCDEWFNSFQTFLDDMGKRPTLGHTLDRIDGTQGYSKANCRWATKSEQGQNRVVKSGRRTGQKPRSITYNGETLKLHEWAARLGISATALRHRIDSYGWTLDEALGMKPRGVSRGAPKTSYIEWNGVTKHITMWAAAAGISPELLWARYVRLEWSMDRIMTTPARHKAAPNRQKKSRA